MRRIVIMHWESDLLLYISGESSMIVDDKKKIAQC